MRAAESATTARQPQKLSWQFRLVHRTPATRSRNKPTKRLPSTPEFFQAVGQYYDDFSQTTDEDVRELLARGS